MSRQFEPRRAVEVVFPKYGSAYRIGGRLVLTAAHFLAEKGFLVEKGSKCRVRARQSLGELKAFSQVEATVVWKAPESDIALIELPEVIPPCEAVMFGQLPETQTGEKIGFKMYGYPQWNWTDRGVGRPRAAGGKQVEGTISLANISADGLLSLRIDEPLTSEYPLQKIEYLFKMLKSDSEALEEFKPDSEWRAMSGAAVVCDGLVVAVQKQHQNPAQPAYLEAEPLCTIYGDEQWRSLLRKHGINPVPTMIRLGNCSGDGEATERPKFEGKLLRKIKEEVDGQLKDSLLNAELIILDKQTQPEQVFRSSRGKGNINFKPSEALPPETRILSVFEQESGKLLILGEPGAGKTTVLLDLLQDLRDMAEANLDKPIPVLFELSSWRKNLSIEDWMVEQLKLIYLLPKENANALVKEGRILPLLDGLDEVQSDQDLCMEAINELLQKEYCPEYLVVCSRREEYEQIVQSKRDKDTKDVRLCLNNAVLLKPITPEQIQTYLCSVSQVESWHLIQQDAELLKLAQIPLFLSILCLIQLKEEFSLNEWQSLVSTESRQKYLFDRFWETKIECNLVEKAELDQGIKSNSYGKGKIPSSIETEKWLAWLAENLERESRQIFLIEQLQPTWLQENSQRQTYLLIYVFITVMLAGLPMGYAIFTGVNIIVTLETVSLFFKVGCTGGMTGWEITTPLRPKPSIRVILELLKKSRIYLVSGLSLLLLSNALIALYTGYAGMTRAIILSLSSGPIVVIAIVIGMYVELMRTTSTALEKEEKVTRPNQGIKRLMATTFAWTVTGFFLAVLLQLVFRLREWASYQLIAGSTEIGWLLATSVGLWLLPDPILGAGFGFLNGLRLGGLDCLKHFALRCVLYWSGNIPWNYAQFLDYCTERKFIQKVGGRYKFIHGLFQKYVAQRKGIDEVNSV